MLQTFLDAPRPPRQEIELVFLQDGSWPRELSDGGLRVHVLDAGRLREPLRLARCVTALAGLLRARRPDLLVGWIAKSQLYAAPAARLAGMPERVAWWQHEIPSRHWMDRLATLLPATAVLCSSRAAAEAQQRLRPRRSTVVVEPGVPAPPAGEQPAQAPPGGGGPVLEGEPVVGGEPVAGEPVVGIVGRLQ